MSHPLWYTNRMNKMKNEKRKIDLNEKHEIAANSEATHVRFTYANNAFHEYPIEKLDEAIEMHKWNRLGLKYGVKLNEKCSIKNDGIASGWDIDDFIQIGKTDYSWNNEQTSSPAWEYMR